jgi:hypothetical protein
LRYNYHLSAPLSSFHPESPSLILWKDPTLSRDCAATSCRSHYTRVLQPSHPTRMDSGGQRVQLRDVTGETVQGALGIDWAKLSDLKVSCIIPASQLSYTVFNLNSRRQKISYATTILARGRIFLGETKENLVSNSVIKVNLKTTLNAQKGEDSLCTRGGFFRRYRDRLRIRHQ